MSLGEEEGRNWFRITLIFARRKSMNAPTGKWFFSLCSYQRWVLSFSLIPSWLLSSLPRSLSLSLFERCVHLHRETGEISLSLLSLSLSLARAREVYVCIACSLSGQRENLCVWASIEREKRRHIHDCDGGTRNGRTVAKFLISRVRDKLLLMSV